MDYDRGFQAVRNAPAKPYLTDDYNPTNPDLWRRVLDVARGDLRIMTRVGPNGPRTIHAPNKGLGFRHWPNPKAVAWAVKQYKGFGGRWKGEDEDKVVTAAASKQPTGWLGFRVPASTSRLLSQIDVPGKREDEGALHTTVIYMGATQLDDFCEAVKAAYSVATRTSPFTLKTRRVISFSEGDEGYPIVCDVESDALHEFKEALDKGFDKAGVDYNKKWPTYRPHVCLSYSPESMATTKIPVLEWGAHELVMWLGHNGAAASVGIPLGRKIRNSFVSAPSFETRLSCFRTLWRYKTRNTR